MSFKITVKGLASGKTSDFEIEALDLDKTILEFLNEKEVPIASSCNGRTACEKCKIDGEVLACTVYVKEYINKIIKIDYL